MCRLAVIVFLFVLGILTIAVGFVIQLIFGERRRLVLIGSLLSRVLNVTAGPLLNRILRKSGPEFGSASDTTSKILGGVKVEGELTTFGRFIVFMLHQADPMHCEKEWNRKEL